MNPTHAVTVIADGNKSKGMMKILRLTAVAGVPSMENKEPSTGKSATTAPHLQRSQYPIDVTLGDNPNYTVVSTNVF
jgi:hypothetical protein